MDQREISPIPVLRHADVLKIPHRFRSLNPYSFGGDLLKVEDVNYKEGNPETGSLRTVYGYAISAKRYALMEGSKIIEVKGHGLGYLMSPLLAMNRIGWKPLGNTTCVSNTFCVMGRTRRGWTIPR